MALELYGLNGKDEWARMRNNKQRKSFLKAAAEDRSATNRK